LKQNNYLSLRRALFLLLCGFPNRFQLREEVVRDMSVDAGWRDVPGHSAILVRNALRERYDLIRVETRRLLAPVVGKNRIRVENTGLPRYFPESSTAWFVG
jgi:hypothetical protein